MSRQLNNVNPLKWVSQIRKGATIMSTTTTATSNINPADYLLPKNKPDLPYYAVSLLDKFVKFTVASYKSVTGVDAPPLDINRPPKRWIDPDYIQSAFADPSSQQYLTPVYYTVLDPTTKSLIKISMPAGWAGSINLPKGGWTLINGQIRYLNDNSTAASLFAEVLDPLRDLDSDESFSVLMTVPMIVRNDIGTPASSASTPATFSAADSQALQNLQNLFQSLKTEVDAIYNAIPTILQKVG